MMKECGIHRVAIYTDSYFVIQTHARLKTWETQGWLKKNGKKLMHQADYKMYAAASKNMSIKFIHVKAHSGNPGNEAADSLAKIGSRIRSFNVIQF